MRYLVAALCLFVTACASQTDPLTLPAVGSGREPVPAFVIPTKEFYTRDQSFLSLASKTKGLILLRKANADRNKQVCDAFVQLAPTSAATAMGLSANQIAPTIWPVTQATDSTADCNVLLDNYDYDAAAIYLQLLNKPSAQGPILAAVTDGKVAFIDLSRAKKKHIRALVPAWSRAIGANNGNSIVMDGSFFNEACLAIGADSQYVSGEVYDIIDDSSKPGWADVVKAGLTVAGTVLPGVDRIVSVAQMSCSKVI